MLRSSLNVSRDQIERLLAMDYKTFYEKGTRRKNYTLAFAIVYYLWKGAPSVKKFSYHSVLPKYYTALTEGKTPKEATSLAWSGVDMDTFSSDLSKFWNKKRSIKHSIKFKLKSQKNKTTQ
jgi:hypothetical protein